MKRQQLSQGAEIIQPTPTGGGGMQCFTPTKREGGNSFSHAEGGGAQ